MRKSRWTENGKVKHTGNDYEIIYVRKNRHEYGVGILVHMRLINKISVIINKSEKIISQIWYQIKIHDRNSDVYANFRKRNSGNGTLLQQSEKN